MSEKIKEARKAAGLTQQQMSDEMGIPKRTIENWETGSRNCPEWTERLIVAELKRIKERKEMKKWIMIEENYGGDNWPKVFDTQEEEIAKYVPIVVKLCYAIAGVVAVVGAISVYIAMNNEEQDVKKKIMMVVGACIFLIAAAQALPLFFGLS